MITIGVRIGKRHESSAICVAEADERRVDGRAEDNFLVRHLERIPAGSSYVTVARRVGEVTGEVYWRRENPPDLFVDATGLGQPVLDLVEGSSRTGGSSPSS